MFHKAFMPLYKGSRFLARAGGWTNQSEVVQEVLADLKMLASHQLNTGFDLKPPWCLFFNMAAWLSSVAKQPSH